MYVDVRPNSIKKESEKWAVWPHEAKGKSKKKWRSNFLRAVVGFNWSWIFDKSYRKSNELYFRVADSRPAINKMEKLYLSCLKIRLEGPKCTPGGSGGTLALGGGGGKLRRRRMRRIAAGAAGFVSGPTSLVQQ